jgi:hypothetical protein
MHCRLVWFERSGMRYCFHLKGCPLLLDYSENGDGMVLRNFGSVCRSTRRYVPEDGNFVSIALRMWHDWCSLLSLTLDACVYAIWSVVWPGVHVKSSGQFAFLYACAFGSSHIWIHGTESQVNTCVLSTRNLSVCLQVTALKGVVLIVMKTSTECFFNNNRSPVSRYSRLWSCGRKVGAKHVFLLDSYTSTLHFHPTPLVSLTHHSAAWITCVYSVHYQ